MHKLYTVRFELLESEVFFTFLNVIAHLNISNSNERIL